MAMPSSQVIGKPCRLDDCETLVTPNSGKGLCKKHYNRLLRHGDPAVILPSRRKTSQSGSDSHRWKGDKVGYFAVHERLRTQRGRASAHKCSHCSADAEQWAFNHRGNPSVGEMEYSTNLNDYIALCVSCHKRFDHHEG